MSDLSLPLLPTAADARAAVAQPDLIRTAGPFVWPTPPLAARARAEDRARALRIRGPQRQHHHRPGGLRAGLAAAEVGPRIGQVLVEQASASAAQVEQAAAEQQALRNRKLGDLLVTQQVGG